MRKRKWTEQQLRQAANKSRSLAGVLKCLGLIPAGGNYAQIKLYLREFKIDHSHFTGRAWNRGISGYYRPIIPLEEILVKGSAYQSFKLKRRLFIAGLKEKECEMCGWCHTTPEGYLPLELDHINGDRTDNRLENLRVLCPNCHSLQPTHRGRNMGKIKRKQ